MSHVLRPLIQWPRWRRCCSTFPHLTSPHSYPTDSTTSLSFFAPFSTAYRQVLSRSRTEKLRNFPPLSEVDDGGEESSDSSDEKKSRNQKKRDARRAVRWGMDLANFSPSQIKRILRATDLEQEVFDAIMLVKRFGRDVREGKRRQYNYIGGLLREVERPELMDGLIKATKDGDQEELHDLLGIKLVVGDEKKGKVEISDEEEEEEEEEEDSTNMAVVTRWFDGLINKDVGITNEIYSLQEVDFDRQELRQLVRKVQSVEVEAEETAKPDAAAKARRSLTLFLRGLANQLPVE